MVTSESGIHQHSWLREQSLPDHVKFEILDAALDEDFLFEQITETAYKKLEEKTKSVQTIKDFLHVQPPRFNKNYPTKSWSSTPTQQKREKGVQQIERQRTPDAKKSSKPYESKQLLVISETTQQYLMSRWITIFIPSVYTAVVILSLVLNCIAVLAFILKMKHRKPSEVYLLNLAIADILFCMSLPFKIDYYFSGNNWYFGSGMCQIVTAAFYCNMYCSVLLITCIAVDRFLAVVYPLRSLSWRSCSCASFVCCVTWILAIVSTIPLFCTEQISEVVQLNITTCHDVGSVKFLSYYGYYFPVISSAFFFVPLIVNSVCYTSIIRCLIKNKVSKCKRKRAIFLTVAVFLIFLLCFAPANFLLIINYMDFSECHDSVYFIYLLSLCISSLNCCIDPVIYYFASSQCRQLFQKWFHFRNKQTDTTIEQEITSQTSLSLIQKHI
ncbi:proteinase-activated receptor 1-like [Protopterus annectens]|uniref:proteinase-activated receptor 1-like n=1 Tax=Protopterus annectens TaxID=7888 RepID=UPI001CFAF7D4|nr:proteinase-activated receptor 1-like [Protopterus annectens]